MTRKSRGLGAGVRKSRPHWGLPCRAHLNPSRGKDKSWERSAALFAPWHRSACVHPSARGQARPAGRRGRKQPGRALRHGRVERRAADLGDLAARRFARPCTGARQAGQATNVPDRAASPHGPGPEAIRRSAGPRVPLSTALGWLPPQPGPDAP